MARRAGRPAKNPAHQHSGLAALASRNLTSYRRVRDFYFLTIRVNDERCAAEAYIRDLHRSAIEADDFGAVPPYYPDCGVWLRVEIRKAR